MAKSPVLRTIARAKFRCAHAAKAWAELAEIVREAAAQPGYTGPSLASVERVSEEIAATRAAIVSWTLDVAAARPRSPHADEVRAIRYALGQSR